jgi:hypothetical protein
MKDWRTLINHSDSYAQYPQNPQNPVCGGNSVDIEDIGDKTSCSGNQLRSGPQAANVLPTPKFTPGQQVMVTDNLNRVRGGVIQFADWIDEPLTAKGWWYLILDAHGLLSETHESRLTDAGLIKKVST